jgi:type IV pilus assembly protein PilO
MNLDFNNIGDIPVSIKIIIVAFISAIIFYFAYFLDFASLQRIIKTNEQHETDLKTQLAGLIGAEAIIDTELSHLPQLQKILAEWQGQLIKPSELPALLNEILKIGTANTLQFDLFNPGEKLKEDQYMKVPIRVIVRGSYDQIANFISQVANMKWLVGIESFNIEKKAMTDTEKKAVDQSSPSHIVSEINLEVYYLADK